MRKDFVEGCTLLTSRRTVLGGEDGQQCHSLRLLTEILELDRPGAWGGVGGQQQR